MRWLDAPGPGELLPAGFEAERFALGVVLHLVAVGGTDLGHLVGFLK